MTNYKEIDGDLIELAKNGEFDVITHGCNCFCVMGNGIAPQMAKSFACNKFYKEREVPGNINKLGTIDCGTSYVKKGAEPIAYASEVDKSYPYDDGYKKLTVINSYSQYNFGNYRNGGIEKPIDYDALTLCMRKINHKFKGQHVGLPKIGAGLAGGDWERIKSLIQQELKDCKITVVIFKDK